MIDYTLRVDSWKSVGRVTFKGRTYKYIKDFHEDLSVTEQDLINAVRAGFKHCSVSNLTRHKNLTIAVLDEMILSPVWYVKGVGMFHIKRDPMDRLDYAIVYSLHQDGRLRNMAKDAAWSLL